MSKSELKSAAEKSLFVFAKLIGPLRVYGEVHEKVYKFLQKSEDALNQLLLLPRGHLKSHCLAVWCAWWVTRHPETTILYISATAQLAEDQLYAIKCIFDSDIYRRYWPEMLDKEEGKRSKWSTTAINVDHPTRTKEMVRDNTIRTAGLTTNTTGWHADIIIADDVVVPENAYTDEGRRRCASAMSQMASILNAGGMIKAAGTRYHPADQYNEWITQEEPLYGLEGDIIGQSKVWVTMEEVVEIDGSFLWPREARTDGKEFGFDLRQLARKKAMYTDQSQFYAQYYNNPNDPDSNRVDRNRFQYYDQKYLKSIGASWYFKEKRLNIYAGIDFAFSVAKRADFSVIIVLGVDEDNDIYILAIDRFKTSDSTEYFKHLTALYNTWGFRKLRAEVSVAQQIIVNDLKRKFKEAGVSIKVDEFRPSTGQGNKEERIAAILEPRYQEQSIWHYRGGYTAILEEELLLAKPPHDDCKDCLASIVEVAQRPRSPKKEQSNVIPFADTYNKRFGGFGTNMHRRAS